MAAWNKDLDAPAATPKRPAWERDLARPATQEAAPNPTDGMPLWQRVAAGVGKTVFDTGRGLAQLARSAIGDQRADAIGLPTQADVDEAARLDKSLMATGGGIAGNVIGQVAQMAIPGAGLAKLAPAVTKLNPIARAATGAGAFAATQPVVTGDSRLGNAAEGAAFGAGGQVLASAAGAVARGASNAITPEIRALALKAEAAGIPVNIAQLGDSRFLKTLQSTLERLPFTGAQQARNVQQEALNRAVSRTFGADVPRVTSDVYAGAKTRIGQEFERLTAQNNLDANTPGLLSKLTQLTVDAQRFGTDDTARAVSNAVEELLSKADNSGLIPGRAYQSQDSLLGRLTKAGGEKAIYLGQVREAARDAMDASISAADREAWNTARRQYANLKTVRDLIAKDSAEGNISPALLRGRVLANEASKERMASGTRGELGDLSEIAYRFVRDPVPDSGTSQRLLANSLLLGGGAGLVVDPTSTLGTLAAAATLGRGSNALMNSAAARRYMLSGVQTPVARRLLESTAVAPLALPAVSNALQQ